MTLEGLILTLLKTNAELGQSLDNYETRLNEAIADSITDTKEASTLIINHGLDKSLQLYGQILNDWGTLATGSDFNAIHMATCITGYCVNQIINITIADKMNSDYYTTQATLDYISHLSESDVMELLKDLV